MRANNMTAAEDFRSAPVRNATLDPASFLCDRPFVVSAKPAGQIIARDQKNDGAAAGQGVDCGAAGASVSWSDTPVKFKFSL